MSLNTPIVFLIFNRPDVTKRVFERIAQAKPRRLIVVADGPRADRQEDFERVRATRAVVEKIDWPCETIRDYATENMGCKHRVATGISTALEQFEQAIVVEDDCLPDLSFFPFCENLLEYYQNDDRVGAISGDNFQFGRSRTDYSYYFSKYMHCWGWATWRRAWKNLDLEMDGWPEFRDGGGMKAVADSPAEELYWTRVFDRQYAGEIRSWGYPWLFSCWSQSQFTILPDRNLVSNIGFGQSATHTTKTENRLANLPTVPLNRIEHPSMVVRNHAADQSTFSQVFCDPRPKIVRWASKLGRQLQRVKSSAAHVLRRSA